MSFDMITFLEELENYEFGVKHIIPAKYHPADIPGAFTDELDNILYARTYLEKQLSLYPQEVDQSAYFSRLEAADKLLQSKWVGIAFSSPWPSTREMIARIVILSLVMRLLP